jgi:hypothetical protein
LKEWIDSLSSLAANWEIKSIIGLAVTSVFGKYSNILGGAQEAFVSLWVLVLVDLVTKWYSIFYCVKKDRSVTWIQAVKISFKERKINGEAMRNKFLPKCLYYIVAIGAFHYLSATAGGISLLGYEVGHLEAVGPLFIYLYLGLTEVISILNNLIACDAPSIFIQLRIFLVKRRNNLVGADNTEVVEVPEDRPKAGNH